MDNVDWISEFGGVCDRFFTRNYYVKESGDVKAFRKEFVDACRNTDVYQCVYRYENEDVKNCKIIGDPYLDFDAENIKTDDGWQRLTSEVKYVVNYLEIALRIAPEELHLYFSGNKGFHIILPGAAVGIQASENLNEVFRHFALGMAFLHSGKSMCMIPHELLDLRIYDRRRLLRLPNSINSKSGIYKVPVTIDQLYDYSYEEMVVWAKKPREEKFIMPPYRSVSAEGFNEIIKVGKDYLCERDGHIKRHRTKKKERQNGEILPLLPCTKKLLEAGAQKGVRNNACFALASSLLQSGYSLDTVYGMVEEWNDKNGEPLPGREVSVTVKSAAASYDNGMVVGCGKYRELDFCEESCMLLQS